MKLQDIQYAVDPNKRRQIRASHLASGLTIGAALGATAGVLFAPYSGRLTRAKLRYKARRSLYQSQDKIADAKETVKVKADQVADKAVNKGKAAKETKTRVNRNSDNG